MAALAARPPWRASEGKVVANRRCPCVARVMSIKAAELVCGQAALSRAGANAGEKARERMRARKRGFAKSVHAL